MLPKFTACCRCCQKCILQPQNPKKQSLNNISNTFLFQKRSTDCKGCYRFFNFKPVTQVPS